MTIHLEKLDLALDRVFEAAVDPLLWPEILQQIADATGAYGANIIPTVQRAPGVIFNTENLGKAFEEYFDDGWHLNDWRERSLPLIVRDGIATDLQYTSEEDFRAHPYYRFHNKHGIGPSCLVGFSSEQDMLCLTLHRRVEDSFFERSDLAVLRMMRERLTSASLFARSLSAHKIEGMADAFQLANVAAIFFDRFGKVTRVNDRAEALLGAELQVRLGELTSKVQSETSAIRARMQAVISERWLRPVAGSGVLRIRREHRAPILVRIQRLGGNLPDLFTDSIGVCLLEDLGAPPHIGSGSLASLFGLTRAETRIALHLAQGADLRTAAEISSISYETARSHLRAIFAKTDTSRQSELVAMLARLRLLGESDGETG